LNGTDKFAFTALPGGTGNVSPGTYGCWWSDTEYSNASLDNALTFCISDADFLVNQTNNPKSSMYSVRCVKDGTFILSSSSAVSLPSSSSAAQSSSGTVQSSSSRVYNNDELVPCRVNAENCTNIAYSTCIIVGTPVESCSMPSSSSMPPVIIPSSSSFAPPPISSSFNSTDIVYCRYNNGNTCAELEYFTCTMIFNGTPVANCGTQPSSSSASPPPSSGSSSILPSSAASLTAGYMVNGTIATSGGEAWYSFTATAGNTYYIWFNDSDYDYYNYSLDGLISAYYANGTAIFSNYDVISQSFTATSSGTVYVKVSPYYSNTGNFAIGYSTTNSRPSGNSNMSSSSTATCSLPGYPSIYCKWASGNCEPIIQDSLNSCDDVIMQCVYNGYYGYNGSYTVSGYQGLLSTNSTCTSHIIY
jgi:hypothetical protein